MEIATFAFKIFFGFITFAIFAFGSYFAIRFYKNLNKNEKAILMQFYLDKEVQKSLKILSLTAIIFCIGLVFDIIGAVFNIEIYENLGKILLLPMFLGFLNFSKSLYISSKKILQKA